MNKKTVFIAHGSPAYIAMFIKHGYKVIGDMTKADLVVFTGGADVDPILYKQNQHPRTFVQSNRDRVEATVFDVILSRGAPMAGICRGGQLLNVLSGGSMYQHVDNHTLHGTHEAVDTETGEVFHVTSTHHQMMRPSEEAKLLAYAQKISSFKEWMNNNDIVHKASLEGERDVEVVFYKKTKCLCFQPHPEMSQFAGCTEAFFKYLHKYCEV